MIIHKPVLLKEVLDYIPIHAKLIVDGTLGHGGHTLEMIKKLITPLDKGGKGGFVPTLIGLDLDQKMLEKAKEQITNSSSLVTRPPSLHFVHDSYTNIDKILKKFTPQGVADFILIDIGVNLEHFKDPSRGFSIKSNADLDMRYDQNAEKSAFTIINKYNPTELSQMFQTYGDFAEHKASELAKAIVKERKNSPIQDTFGLKTILNSCGLGEKAVAVIFQAIRIETNDELQNLKQFLEKFPNYLNSGGRCIVISYHSGEDRLVKNRFKELGATEKFKLLTKKVIKPHYTEVQSNKASRSAKLRVIEKL